VMPHSKTMMYSNTQKHSRLNTSHGTRGVANRGAANGMVRGSAGGGAPATFADSADLELTSSQGGGTGLNTLGVLSGVGIGVKNGTQQPPDMKNLLQAQQSSSSRRKQDYK